MKFRSVKNKLLYLAIFIGISSLGFSKDIPKKPVPFRLVIDNAGVLSNTENESLNNKLRIFDDSTTTQICIVIDQSLEGEDISDYSQRLAQSWGIGQKGTNNGLLIYVAIKDRKTFIQTGYGLEGVVPDAAAKGIIEDYILPEFRKGNYYAGLDKSTGILISLIKKEYPSDKIIKLVETPLSKYIPAIVIVVILLIMSILKRKNRGGRGGSGWGPFMMGAGTFGGYSGSSGSSGGGGFSSGGFGGGSFGGGGAGGGW